MGGKGYFSIVLEVDGAGPRELGGVAHNKFTKRRVYEVLLWDIEMVSECNIRVCQLSMSNALIVLGSVRGSAGSDVSWILLVGGSKSRNPALLERGRVRGLRIRRILIRLKITINFVRVLCLIPSALGHYFPYRPDHIYIFF